jgi:hypothetical protein
MLPTWCYESIHISLNKNKSANAKYSTNYLHVNQKLNKKNIKVTLRSEKIKRSGVVSFEHMH